MEQIESYLQQICKIPIGVNISIQESEYIDQMKSHTKMDIVKLNELAKIAILRVKAIIGDQEVIADKQ